MLTPTHQIHTVHFDQDNKIQHIRIFWDQGALLRQVDIIGSRGKNWPICDSKDQARLVASGPSALASNKAPAVMSRGREMNEVPAASRSESPSKKHMKDPHSSLELFGPEKVDAGSGRSQPNAIAPRVSAKPPQREMSELFAAGHEDYEPGRPRSPLKKENQPVIIPPKGAGGQKFQPSRLFSEDPDTDSPALYKSNPAKYDHFDIGDAPQQDHFQHARAPLSENAIPLRARTNKHVSQWGFEDFVTPEKVRPKTRSQDQRHFGWSDDEGENAETPGKHPKVAAPRPSSEVHFEMKDDGVLSAKKRPTGPAKGSLSNKSLGLYQNNVSPHLAPLSYDVPIVLGHHPVSIQTQHLGYMTDDRACTAVRRWHAHWCSGERNSTTQRHLESRRDVREQCLRRQGPGKSTIKERHKQHWPQY